MKGRRATRGIISTMARSPRGKPKPVHRTPLQKIGFWAGAIAIGAVGVVIVAAFVYELVSPPKTVHQGEAEVPILELAGPPPGSLPAIVAGAVVELEGQRATIPLTEPQRATVENGTVLRVKYTAIPSLRTVRVDAWEKKP